jgi:N-acetyl-anhydromuramyl-L-alanine amidase AmpD
MYFIGGDNKADLDVSYSQAETRLKTPSRDSSVLPFKCLSGSIYAPFGADTFWVDQVCPSKNVLSRTDGPLHPGRTGPLYIVMHCTDGKTVQAAIDQFQRRIGSAQYVIGPNGEIVQMVSEQHTAGHVKNVHTWEGQVINNYNSIGIEMVGECGRDKRFKYSDAIYEASAKLVSDIILRALNSNRVIQPNFPDPNTGTDEPDRKYILGHEEIQKQDVDVRTDPGAQWDWDRFMSLIRFEWMGQLLQGRNDIAPVTLLSVQVTSQNRHAIKVKVTWKAKANGRNGFRIWRRAEGSSYDLNEPLPKRIPGALSSERGLRGDYEVEKTFTDEIIPPPPGTVKYCYSVWAYAERTPDTQLQLGYYGGPLTLDKLLSREMCIDISAAASPSGIESLSVTAIALTTQDNRKTLNFQVTGQGVASTSIQIFSLAGRRVFDSGEVQSNTFTWSLQNNAGQPLANGVYLYVVRVRGFDGREYVSEVRKLVILR